MRLATLSRARKAGRAAVLQAIVATAAGASHAQPPPAAPAATEDARRTAHEEYEAGKAAFEAHDYLRAAHLFLDAYRLSPHHDPLWNAARAYELAGERARAANLYARYLTEAPPDARDRDRATEARKQLAATLGRLDIQAHDVTDVQVDGESAEAALVYVDPGQHMVHAQAGERAVERVQSVAAGHAVSVVLEPPPPVAAAPPAPPPATRGTRVLPPWVAFAGAGAGVALGALTVWSSLDTVSTKHQFESSPSQSLLDSGRAKQERTNVLFWSTVGIGAATGLVALFFVDWRGNSTAARVGVGPSSLELSGAF